MDTPELSQLNITLECPIHQLGTAGADNRGLENCYQPCCYAYAANCGYIGWIEISSAQSGSIMATPVSGARHRHVDYLRSELRQLVQPCGRKSAGYCAFAVAPYGGADSRSIAELAVVDEIHPATAALPFARLDSALHRLEAESGVASLSECDYPILLSKHVLEHTEWTRVTATAFHLQVISVRKQALSAR